jgi:hypothetical protein
MFTVPGPFSHHLPQSSARGWDDAYFDGTIVGLFRKAGFIFVRREGFEKQSAVANAGVWTP